MSWKRLAHRSLKSAGIALQRYRDPYDDVKRLFGKDGIRSFIDGGAYHGGHSLQVLSLYPNASIYAFEPQPDTREQLLEKLGGVDRVSVFPLALSDQLGSFELHVNQRPYETSLLAASDDSEIDASHVVNVPVTTLDHWVSEEGVNCLDMIKLDLQGNELAALRGSERLLQSGVKAILTEVNFRSRYDGGCLYHELDAHLSGFDFRLFRMYDVICDPNGAWRQADALFVKGPGD